MIRFSKYVPEVIRIVSPSSAAARAEVMVSWQPEPPPGFTQ
jgi:hypothetical protein